MSRKQLRSELGRVAPFQIIGLALLFVMVCVFSTRSGNAQNRPWTTTGSSGTIDEDSLPNASVTNFVLGFKLATTGSIVARYNITPTRDLSNFCPATSTHVAIRFRDEDASATGDQVLLTIHRSSITSGGDTTIFTFDSNVSAQPLGSAFQTFAADAPIDFDFASSIYWVEVQLSRTNPNGFVNFGALQIAEKLGTSCP